MVDPVLLSEVTLPKNHPRAADACVVFGFVIHHAGGPILVDTGVGVGHPGIDSLCAPVHHPIEDAVAKVGVRPVEVTMVINSHLHFDHCGNDRLFPGIPLVVQQTEYENALQTGYTIPDWIEFPGAMWRPVNGKAEVLPDERHPAG